MPGKTIDPVTQKELVEEDPAQIEPPAQILLEDTPTVVGEAPAQAKPKASANITQSELVREDPAQTVPPAQILLEDTKTIPPEN